MSMYRQLWLAIITSMLLALAGSLFASMLNARAYLESQLSIKNADNAAALALSLSQSDPDAVSVELTVSALFDSGHYELIRVVDPAGHAIVERSAPRGNNGDSGAPAWFARLLGGAPLDSGLAGRSLSEAAASLLDEAWTLLAADCAREGSRSVVRQ